MKFTHTANPCVMTQDGQEIYVSRANAVVGEVFLYAVSTKQWYVLVVKRGTAMPDYQGYWCFPCGYLDWDERLDQAIVRELWEETGLYLQDPQLFEYKDHCISELRHKEQTKMRQVKAKNAGNTSVFTSFLTKNWSIFESSTGLIR